MGCSQNQDSLPQREWNALSELVYRVRGPSQPYKKNRWPLPTHSKGVSLTPILEPSRSGQSWTERSVRVRSFLKFKVRFGFGFGHFLDANRTERFWDILTYYSEFSLIFIFVFCNRIEIFSRDAVLL